MSELGAVGRSPKGGGSRGGYAFPPSRAYPPATGIETIAHGYSAAWRLRNEPRLTEAERLALVTEAIGELAEEEGVSASAMIVRAAESYVLVKTWEDGR
jgi:hypothetical protein